MHRRHRLLPTYTFLFVSLALSASAFAQQTSSTAAAPGDFSAAPYLAGEKLTYNVSFSNFTTAGHVEMFNAGRGQFFNRDGIQLRARVQTVGVVRAALYALDNEYTAYVDPQTGLPFHTQVQQREGGSAVAAAQTPALANQPSVEATPATYDFLSALYR
ncbi:MAG TPA: DUF3108 domain-containing protein, partial [Pyrinomonadaceae bacterium]|nr:DUF3108 domain-containing protein [Pyrinomonadaceae bacterium]